MVGKRVGASLYVHKEALPLIGASADPVRIADAAVPGDAWNVAKIQKDQVSLLLYESFDEPFPALLTSAKIDLATGGVTRTDYRERRNPPILHRKELLLPPDDPRLPQFRALTAAAEDHGLFRDTKVIGTRLAWNELIAKAGLALRRGRLVPANEEILDVARHRTAIVRRDLSQPMQLMMRFGIVSPERGLFDYGCGQGEDVQALVSDGIEAFGWDPHHAPRGERRSADIVNLGFVLNVIEDPRERAETLKTAWGFTQRALCVSVMLQGKALTAAHRPYRDGFVTSRGTFQKYFAQQELQGIVANGTGQTVLALAPGIVVAFRDKELEQEVLLRRRSRAFLTNALPRPPERQRVVVARPSVRERLAGVLEQLRSTALAIGRLPEPEEASREVVDALAAQRIGWARALDLLGSELSEDEAFARSRESRREDLRVHFALGPVGIRDSHGSLAVIQASDGPIRFD
jgi:hypothetical protein